MIGQAELKLVKRHKNYDKSVIKVIKNQNDPLIQNLVTKEARTFYGWHRQVLGCYHRIRSFCRLNISKHGFVYTTISPEHKVEDLVAQWFRKRFPLFEVLVKSPRGLFYIDIDDTLKILDLELNDFIKNLEANKPIDPLLDNIEELDEGLWNNYYKSQYIKERKNKRYFLHNIPKKYLKDMNLETKEFNNNKTLSNFF